MEIEKTSKVEYEIEDLMEIWKVFWERDFTAILGFYLSSHQNISEVNEMSSYYYYKLILTLSSYLKSSDFEENSENSGKIPRNLTNFSKTILSNTNRLRRSINYNIIIIQHKHCLLSTKLSKYMRFPSFCTRGR